MLTVIPQARLNDSTQSKERLSRVRTTDDDNEEPYSRAAERDRTNDYIRQHGGAPKFTQFYCLS
jgi:hypothetical protein